MINKKSHNIVLLTDNTIHSFINNSKKLLIIDFWANWCNPCKIISPILESISREYVNKLDIAKLDIDEGTKSSVEYSIKSIPTLLFIKNKKILFRNIGIVSKLQLQDLIEQFINT